MSLGGKAANTGEGWMLGYRPRFKDGVGERNRVHSFGAARVMRPRAGPREALPWGYRRTPPQSSERAAPLAPRADLVVAPIGYRPGGSVEYLFFRGI